MVKGEGNRLRSQSSTAFARDLISENGFFRKSFACQTRRSIEACSPKKKKKMKKKKKGTFNTSFGKHDISAAPHTGQPPTGTAANFRCISCHCRRLSSGHPQGKWNGQTTRALHWHVSKKRELPCGRRPEHVLQTCDTDISKTRRTIYTIQTVKCKQIFQGSWSCHHLSTDCAYFSRISQNVHASQHGEITGLNLGRLRVQKA